MNELITILLMFAPLMLVLWLANLADKQRQAERPTAAFALLAYGLLVLLWLGLFGGGIAVALAGQILAAQSSDPVLLDAFTGMGIGAETAARVIASLPALGLALWLPALIGLLLLLPPLRRLLSRVLPIDPGSVVHAVALSYTMLIVINLWATVVFGIDTLADIMAAGEPLQTRALLNITWGQEILFVLLAAVGVGWLSRLNLRQTLARLAITWPTPRQAALAAGLGLGMTLLLIPLEYLMQLTGIGIDEDVARLGEQVIGPLMLTIPGILTLGLAAALGEEALFRGALQPRFGLWLTALLFALLHSTYGLTLSTLIVFGIGLILGWVRDRHNTTTAMIVHATYNMGIGFLAYLALWPEW